MVEIFQECIESWIKGDALDYLKCQEWSRATKVITSKLGDKLRLIQELTQAVLFCNKASCFGQSKVAELTKAFDDATSLCIDTLHWRLNPLLNQSYCSYPELKCSLFATRISTIFDRTKKEVFEQICGEGDNISICETPLKTIAELNEEYSSVSSSMTKRNQLSSPFKRKLEEYELQHANLIAVLKLKDEELKNEISKTNKLREQLTLARKQSRIEDEQYVKDLLKEREEKNEEIIQLKKKSSKLDKQVNNSISEIQDMNIYLEKANFMIIELKRDREEQEILIQRLRSSNSRDSSKEKVYDLKSNIKDKDLIINKLTNQIQEMNSKHNSEIVGLQNKLELSNSENQHLRSIEELHSKCLKELNETSEKLKIIQKEKSHLEKEIKEIQIQQKNILFEERQSIKNSNLFTSLSAHRLSVHGDTSDSENADAAMLKIKNDESELFKIEIASLTKKIATLQDSYLINELNYLRRTLDRTTERYQLIMQESLILKERIADLEFQLKQQDYQINPPQLSSSMLLNSHVASDLSDSDSKLQYREILIKMKSELISARNSNDLLIQKNRTLSIDIQRIAKECKESIDEKTTLFDTLNTNRLEEITRLQSSVIHLQEKLVSQAEVETKLRESFLKPLVSHGEREEVFNDDFIREYASKVQQLLFQKERELDLISENLQNAKLQINRLEKELEDSNSDITNLQKERLYHLKINDDNARIISVMKMRLIEAEKNVKSSTIAAEKPNSQKQTEAPQNSELITGMQLQLSKEKDLNCRVKQELDVALKRCKELSDQCYIVFSEYKKLSQQLSNCSGCKKKQIQIKSMETECKGLQAKLAYFEKRRTPLNSDRLKTKSVHSSGGRSNDKLPVEALFSSQPQFMTTRTEKRITKPTISTQNPGHRRELSLPQNRIEHSIPSNLSPIIRSDNLDESCERKKIRYFIGGREVTKTKTSDGEKFISIEPAGSMSPKHSHRSNNHLSMAQKPSDLSTLIRTSSPEGKKRLLKEQIETLKEYMKESTDKVRKSAKFTSGDLYTSLNSVQSHGNHLESPPFTSPGSTSFLKASSFAQKSSSIQFINSDQTRYQGPKRAENDEYKCNGISNRIGIRNWK